MTIKIIKCNDKLMWYSSMLGSTLYVVREDEDYFWCREPDGYLNIVKKEDAEVLDN